MNKFREFAFCHVASVAVLLMISPKCGAEGPYHFIKEIPVGGEGGWDLLAVDEAARRLYVSHATKVVVIDLDNDTVVGEITDTPGVHGIAIAPKLGRVFTSNGREAKVSVVAANSLATSMKVDTGQNPDTILFEPSQQEVYAFNARGKSATIIAADSGNVVDTVELPGKPEFAVCDSDAGRVYNNIEDKNEVVAIDTKTHKVVDTWPISPGEEASGMAFDAAHHRLFLGCSNKMMVMMDSTTGKVIANVPIGGGVDANAFDPGTQLALSSNGEGNVTIAHEGSPDTLRVVQTLETERGARTMTLDPATHKIYLPSAKYEAAEPGQRRPRIVADSFKVLVYGM
jgi:DNA-binding beta-propeller fold protein YncE